MCCTSSQNESVSGLQSDAPHGVDKLIYSAKTISKVPPSLRDLDIFAERGGENPRQTLLSDIKL